MTTYQALELGFDHPLTPDEQGTLLDMINDFCELIGNDCGGGFMTLEAKDEQAKES